MADRPILFSAPMIRATQREIAAPGSGKTQTRRALKPQPEPWKGFYLEGGCQQSDWTFKVGWRQESEARRSFGLWMLCGFHEDQFQPLRWAPGDRLWVREQWSGLHAFKDTKPSERQSFVGDGYPYLREDVWYWADGQPDFGDWERPRVSIHMPRYASRFTLTVTDVRIERLQDISEADAIAEGIGPMGQGGFGVYGDKTIWEATAVRAYAALWDAINGKGSWDANPWVSATTFSAEERNIDA